MIVKRISGGMFESLSYIVGSNGKAAVIDVGVNSDKIISEAKELGLVIEMVILTHGHIDHVVELDRLVEKTNAKVYVHIDDELFATDTRINVSAFVGKAVTFDTKCKVLKDGSSVKLGDLEFKIIHTPGHTAGSICIEVENTLFSGDTLFAGGYGRVDLPNGDFEEIYNSIVDRLFKLPEEMIVYPGHGGSTTIGREKQSNPIKYAVEW